MSNETPDLVYSTLDEAQRLKVDAAVDLLFAFNRGVRHPFLDALISMKREELSQRVKEGKS